MESEPVEAGVPPAACEKPGPFGAGFFYEESSSMVEES